MIQAAAEFSRVAARLIRKAEALGAVRIGARQLDADADPRRWRRASLIWPLFGKG